MSDDNHYHTLNIDYKSTQDDIKKAFRKSSLLYHPDRDKGDVEKFKNITTAYEVLSNPEKRRNYDIDMSLPFKNFTSSSLNNEDLINMLFQSDGNFGNNDLNGLFTNRRKEQNKKPLLLTKTMQISLEQSYDGCILPLLIERSNNKTQETETIYVTIPKGIDNNEFIIIEKKGNFIDDKQGDVKVIIVINNTSQFKRNGLDLIYTQDITLKEALCGCNFEIKHISSKTLNFSNNSGNIISNNYEKNIPNYGFIRDIHKGNLVIYFNVIFPESLTTKQITELNNIL
jgi:DnaJ-class molecular chaperone